MDNLKIIGASALVSCDNAFSVWENGAVALASGHIVDIGKLETLRRTYPNAPLKFYRHCALLPALVNPHIHFEFSGHKNTFKYGGGFEGWLTSVMRHRESVFKGVDRHIQQAIRVQLRSGVGSVGAISSHGLEREILARTPLRVVFFDELIGSTPHALEQNLADFERRCALSKQHASAHFIPAIAIHAPYSVHKTLAQRVLDKIDLKTPISAHFLESKPELEWLESKQGWFGHFFSDILRVQHPVYSYENAQDFLDLFSKRHLLLVHALFARPEHFQHAKKIAAQVHVITCPRSNRLLSGQLLDLTLLRTAQIPYALATDGKSSNMDIDLLEELGYALFTLPGNLEDNALELLLGCTRHASQALGLSNGSLEVGKVADLSVFPFTKVNTPLEIVLGMVRAKKARALYIQGCQVF
ncbi:aminofutalosine deaminase family hydrolase [Helicobacter felis]|uniref:aminofutalosine deaminase family hydrolase n=1 Tax=Helicobacter felis TaxID=214 RepID=UPI000CEE1D9E|nr:aminofutalosine deaminase family hydrolase [Helicobacter felis]